MTKLTDRRTFAAASAVLTASAAASAAPSNQVRLGIIGTGNRGQQLITAFKPHADCKIVAACDLSEQYRNKAQEMLGSDLEVCDDFRRLIDRKDLDAIIVATPDHWHAVMTIMACKAGKDVYVEKPLAATIKEGRAMVDAARKKNRVVQVGLHRRSTIAYTKIAEVLRAGTIGKITVARAYRLSNMFPSGIGKDTDSPPPAGFNWDMWLGPRRKRPFNPTIAPYKFRWWHEYSSQMGNWGVHYFDAIRWAMNVEAPTSVVAIGGKYAVDDNRDIPDTAEVIFELPTGGLLVFGQYEASGNPALKWGEVEFRGTQGTMYTNENGYEIIPETGGQFQDRKPRMKPSKYSSKEKNAEATEAHARNFLDCVKSRQTPHADVEVGHRSTIFAHLANISLATRSRLDWDWKKEVVTNNDEANKMLHYEYRKPWTLEG
jgi:predicted dehydrogenase